MEPVASDLPLILKALAFAAHKHKDQRRKDVEASPYINHPIALADVLCNEVGITDVEVLCSALLHDTVEDTDTTPEELETEFGSTIRQIVMDVTDDNQQPWLERKELQVQHAARACDKAKLVKLADKICNLRDIVTNPPAKWSPERKQNYYEWANRVIDQIRGTHSGLEQLFDKAYLKGPER
jgi:guanosine-3',5'-bis(diphosphate) 3'-pyrophosphohydrolase